MAAVRDLAEAWTRDLDAIARRVFAHLAAEIPALRTDDELAALTLASCVSNVEAMTTMLRHGVPAAEAQTPVGGVEHARAMAQRGAEVDATLHFYRVGVTALIQDWTTELDRRVPDRQEFVQALGLSTRFFLEYIDLVSSKMSAVHLEERDRRRRRAQLARGELVRSVLTGEADDLPQVEAALGHSLQHRQLAFVAWTPLDAATVDLERVAVALAAATGDQRALTVEDGPHTLWGWLSVRDRVPARNALERALDGLSPSVRIAVGYGGRGLDGLRESHSQALRARRVADLQPHPATLTAYPDCALVDLLTDDPRAARAFVVSELAGLAERTSAVDDLCATVLEVIRPRSSVAVAARVLGVHRNTVLQRIQRAEALRGRGIDSRTGELYAALLVRDLVLPSAAAAGGPG